MTTRTSKHFRRVAALLALPLIFAAPPALAQEAGVTPGEVTLPQEAITLDPAERPISTMGGPVRSFAGDVLPAVGHIRTFDGEIMPSVGHIRTFDGEIMPSVGHIRTFTGEIDPSVGHIRTFIGDLTPYVGHIRTFIGTVDPSVGHIRTFDGEIDPYVGHIRTFEGDIDPYVGHIRTFWGSLTPEAGELDPQVGHIRTFSNAFLPRSGEVLAAWAASQSSGDYAAIAGQLRQLEADGATLWGDAVAKQTGTNFAQGFSDAFLTKWGVDLSNPQTLAGWDVFERQRFLLDWHDNLMLFSGMDSPDHWMNAVNWTPRLTQTQGGGSRAVIGLVDFFAPRDPDVASKVIYSGGYQNIDHPHGAAVGSLIVGSHDGRGVMGIAPQAKVAVYNPFDETLSASWEDVTQGIAAVGRQGAGVINLSLGVPGSTLAPEWRDVFMASAVDAQKNSALYVIAAGNDGLAQTQNIEMKGALDSTFLVVGSVDPLGRISHFSNTPGTACLTEGGKCKNSSVWDESSNKFRKADHLSEGGLLMNRFLVAPGELILVSDGQGGVTRMTGTSFAAPLVSGAIALIHDRWPWLKKHPRDVAKIVLESAQDLGAPGVDPIYGHGLLDVEASQSPLDFGKLKYYEVSGNRMRGMSVTSLQRTGINPLWSTRDMYFIAFEKIDSAERDFLIPLSSRLFDSSLGGQAFQDFVYHRMVDWLGSASFTGRLSDTRLVQGGTLANGWNFAMTGRTVPAMGEGRTGLRGSVELTNPAGTFALGFGSGDGALALAGGNALAMSGDFDPHTGGANPLLGFATGDAHVASRIGVARGLQLTMGVTRQDRSIDELLSPSGLGFADSQVLRSAGGTDAEATMASLAWQANRALNLSLSYTRLAEEGAFFGVRSLAVGDFGRATVSDGLTLAGDAKIGGGLSLFASGTVSQSRSLGDAALGIDGVLGTAFQLGVAKSGLFTSGDQLRLSIAQPLTVESGYAEMRMVGVIDRETGETGLISQRIAIGAPEQRRYRLEALYGTTVLEGTGTLGIFGAAELRGAPAGLPAMTVGGNLKVAF